MIKNLSAPPVSNDRFLRALASLPVDRVPVWVMRQAGRYLPEYRATRAGAGGFLEMCKTPSLAAEVTIQPIDRFGFDAAILFSDILIPLEAMGMPLRFDEGTGPVLSAPIRKEADLGRLSRFDAAGATGFVAETIRLVNRNLGGRAPLIGFAGAPWTVASYAIEGGSTKTFRHSLAWMYGSPSSFTRLLDLIADATADYLEMQIDAGVHAVQLFESWGGILSREAFREIALPPIRKIVERIGGRVPTILYVNGSPQHLDSLRAAGTTAVGVDWRVPLDDVRARIGGGVPLQGNLDPCVLFSPAGRIETEARRVLEQGGGVGHVFNLGHGIMPEVPVESVATLVETVHGWVPPASSVR
jgi:uroporphyrinogen decarboxylase